MGEFSRDARGIAAIEFAIVLPFMLLLYLGGIEIGNGLAIKLKVTESAHIVADLASQKISINNSTMTSILRAATATIAPYSSSNLIVTVSQVSTDASGNAKVSWSDSLNGTARPVGQVMTLPASLVGQANISLILGEVTYAYTPLTSYKIKGTVNLADSYYLFPRRVTTIPRTAS